MNYVHISHIASLIGHIAANALVAALGGTVYRVPARNDSPRHATLAEIIGTAEARELVAYAGGDALYIPKCDACARTRRNAEIIEAYEAGESVFRIARRHQMTERNVWRILKTTTTTTQSPNGDLFGDPKP